MDTTLLPEMSCAWLGHIYKFKKAQKNRKQENVVATTNQVTKALINSIYAVLMVQQDDNGNAEEGDEILATKRKKAKGSTTIG